MRLSRARDTDSVAVDSMNKAIRNLAMSNTPDMGTLDTREGTPVVEGKVVEMSTWVPAGKEVQEDTCVPDTHPDAGT
jgi:hypothetical protein